MLNIQSEKDLECGRVKLCQSDDMVESISQA